MANVPAIIDAVVSVGKTIASDKDIKAFICGTYADGTPRSVTDAVNGEFLSSKQKKKLSKKKKKKKQAKFRL
jgi:hypothetical protein